MTAEEESHPMTAPPEVVEQILAVSLAHPARGCNA